MVSSRTAAPLAAALAALVLASPAAAHVSVSPPHVGAGRPADLTFSVANEDDALGVDHVTLGVPPTFALDDAEAKEGWTQSRTGRTITWSGGSIPRGQFATFSIRGDAPPDAGPVVFTVLAGDRTGKSLTYEVSLEVTSSGTRDSGARSLGKAALGVAVVAGGLALAGLFVGLYLWLRPPPP